MEQIHARMFQGQTASVAPRANSTHLGVSVRYKVPFRVRHEVIPCGVLEMGVLGVLLLSGLDDGALQAVCLMYLRI